MATDVRSQPGTSDECIPNIGPGQRRKRVRMGIAMGVVSAGIAVALLALGAPRAARLLLLLPFWVTGITLFQVREKTCVRLAARDLRNLDSGDEPVADASERAQIRRQARRVYVEAFLLAAAMTALLAVAPA
jgi:hypothetical protein